MTRDDHEVARDLATEAGEVLLKLRDEVGFDDPARLRAAGDAGSHEYLMAALERLRPGDAVLSEEGKDDHRRLSADRVWIVDPLDGTREFAERGRSDWAVHVALWTGDHLAAGAVALPAQGMTLATDKPPATPARTGRKVRIAVSRSRPPAFLQSLAEHLGDDAELVPIGSAGAKISAVILGDVEAYVHGGGQYEWDSAAPAAVALAAGVHASRIDSSPLTYNHSDPYLPDILVCRADLAPTLLAGIRAVTQP